MTGAEAVLECVGKIGIKLVADSCLSVRDTIVFRARVTLSNDRNS